MLDALAQSMLHTRHRNTNGSYECWCRPGYTSKHCTEDINECLSNPCQVAVRLARAATDHHLPQNGNCTDLVNKYRCDCNLGFEGKSRSKLAGSRRKNIASSAAESSSSSSI